MSGRPVPAERTCTSRSVTAAALSIRCRCSTRTGCGDAGSPCARQTHRLDGPAQRQEPVHEPARRAAACACLVLAVLLGTAACSTRRPRPVPPRCRRQRSRRPGHRRPTPSAAPTNGTEPTANPGAQGHGQVDPEATNRTHRCGLHVSEAGRRGLHCGLPRLSASPTATPPTSSHRARPHMSDRYFFEQLPSSKTPAPTPTRTGSS